MFIFRQPEMMDISQTLPTSSIIYVLDMVGVAACTAAATMLAKRLQFDIFGAFYHGFIYNYSDFLSFFG